MFNACLPLNIPSTGNQLYSSLASSTGPGSCWIRLASLGLIHPPGIISFVYGSKIMLVIACLSLTTPSIRKCLFLPQRVFNFSRVLLDVASLPLTSTSNRNYLCLLYHVQARIILCVSNGLMTIPFTRNHLYLLYSVFKHAKITLGVVGLPLTIPSTRKIVFLLHGMFNRVRVILGDAGFPLTFPSPRNHPLLLCELLISPSSRQLFAVLLSFISGSGAGCSSFFPFTGTWTEALTLHFPVTSSRQFVSSFLAFINGIFF